MEPNQAISGQKNNIWANIKEWLKVIIIALIISLPIRFFIAEPFVVNGASMDPTFATGQFLIVDRLSYRLGQPTRGDVVVFKYPNNPKTYYIKRIIGLPGETIKIKDGKVFVLNNSSEEIALNESYITDNHKSYDNLTVKLEVDEYFVMGDNRKESSDSRSWGPLEKEFIIGRPIVRLLPITKISILPGEYQQ